MVVSVQMVRSDIHQYGDVGMELIHIVKLETAEFDDVIVIIVFSYLEGKTLSDVSCQSYIQSGFFKDVINQGGSGSFSIASRNTNHFCLCVSSGKFDFRDDGGALCLQLSDDGCIIGNARAFDNLVSVQNQLFRVFSFFPRNVSFI